MFTNQLVTKKNGASGEAYDTDNRPHVAFRDLQRLVPRRRHDNWPGHREFSLRLLLITALPRVLDLAGRLSRSSLTSGADPVEHSCSPDSKALYKLHIMVNQQDKLCNVRGVEFGAVGQARLRHVTVNIDLLWPNPTSGPARGLAP